MGVANHQVPSFLSGSVFRVQGSLFLEVPSGLARVWLRVCACEDGETSEPPKLLYYQLRQSPKCRHSRGLVRVTLFEKRAAVSAPPYGTQTGTRLMAPGTWWWDPQGMTAASTMSSRGRMSSRAEKVIKPGRRKTARFVARASDQKRERILRRSEIANLIWKNNNKTPQNKQTNKKQPQSDLGHYKVREEAAARNTRSVWVQFFTQGENIRHSGLSFFFRGFIHSVSKLFTEWLLGFQASTASSKTCDWPCRS